MSIRKRGTKYQARVSYIDSFSGEKKESLKTFASKAEAEQWETEQKYKLNKGYELSKSNMVFADFMDMWFNDYKKPNVRANTLNQHRQNIELHIKPYFQKMKLKEINHVRYQKFINDLNDKGYSQRTLAIIHSTMYGAFQIAINPLRFIEVNPADKANIPKNKKHPSEKDLDGENINYIETKNIEPFLENAKKDNILYYLYFKTLIRTGLRKGEASALGINDIDFDKGYLTVNKTLHHQLRKIGNEKRIGEPKTRNSYRRIKIDGEILEELKSLKNMVETNMEIYGEDYHYYEDLKGNKYALLFCGKDGKFIPKSTLFNALVRILEKTKLPRVCIHDLRDTHTVQCLESKMPMEQVAERLGHENIETTVKFYTHITNKMKDDGIDLYEQYLQEIKH